MKPEEFTIENYNFSKLMKAYVRENIHPLLCDKGFFKYSSPISYVREMDKVVHIFHFETVRLRLRLYATYMPLFLPFEYNTIYNYGREVTGATLGLKKGLKNWDDYYIQISEKDFKNNEQFEDCKNEYTKKFKELVRIINELYLTEMDEMNSFDKYFEKMGQKEVIRFGRVLTKQSDKGFLTSIDDSEQRSYPKDSRYIMYVESCLNKDFEKGIEELKILREELEKYKTNWFTSLRDTIEELLFLEEGEEVLTKELFLRNFEKLCNENREKYKLLSKRRRKK